MPFSLDAGYEPSSMNVEELIRTSRAGSEEALGELLNWFRPYLRVIAIRNLDSDLHSKESPSDLVQETFLEAHRDFASFQGEHEAEFIGWLRQILLFNAANIQRKYIQTEKRRIGLEVPLRPNSDVEKPFFNVPVDTPSPSNRAIRSEESRLLDKAIARLPQEYKHVILLRHQELLSFHEIGEVMNRSSEAARKLWSRSVERLQRELIPSDES